ncbi:MAG: ornithine--oxo-acid transaminase [Chitinophagaceae bacterium]|nr:ornithine--oxo-acid transaminase [Chitinophagaceae bacterium]
MEKLLGTQELIALEEKYGASNYHPIPVVLEYGSGVFVWDVEGKKYYDFLSAYSCVNQGHNHPEIIDALTKQALKLSITSRAFHNSVLGIYAEYICTLFGFEKMLPMNSGAEAVESAIKLCRKWGYEKKGIPQNEALIIVCKQNFHGRTTTIVSFSSDPLAKKNFGPFPQGFLEIPYNDLHSLEEALQNKKVAGFLVEPIQGEAGVIVPSDNFISEAKKLCKKNNVLLIADEIQTGLGRTGTWLGVCGNCNCQNTCERNKQTYTKPDILLLGKALSGGTYPISAILSDAEVMNVLTPGTHGSTFGGNPIASKVAMTALEVLLKEKLMLNARKMGLLFRNRIQTMLPKYPIISIVRGKGLLNAIVINDSPESTTAWDICIIFKNNGLLAKPTHGNIIRFAPPLTITEAQIDHACDIIEQSIQEFTAESNALKNKS